MFLSHYLLFQYIYYCFGLYVRDGRQERAVDQTRGEAALKFQLAIGEIKNEYPRINK
mgnify:CR=1 FL=1|tara:strand:+ start:1139 stop:1309 length:171 start_codon:yes stop_codon:yes gene_type:complete